MVKAFSSNLNHSLGGQAISPGNLQYIQSNEIKLGGLDLPTGLDVQTGAVIRTFISTALIFGFRIEMLICSGLSLLCSAVAWRMISSTVAGREANPQG
jgi:hypothetical protein